VFEDRVARALATIGVPARTEIEELKHRIGELERMVAQLAGQGAARKPAAKKAAGRQAPRPAAKSAG
jgi:BMFP domain-containing protein YqiC